MGHNQAYIIQVMFVYCKQTTVNNDILWPLCDAQVLFGLKNSKCTFLNSNKSCPLLNVILFIQMVLHKFKLKENTVNIYARAQKINIFFYFKGVLRFFPFSSKDLCLPLECSRKKYQV